MRCPGLEEKREGKGKWKRSENGKEGKGMNLK